jgi:hypothetical protein
MEIKARLTALQLFPALRALTTCLILASAAYAGANRASPDVAVSELRNRLTGLNEIHLHWGTNPAVLNGTVGDYDEKAKKVVRSEFAAPGKIVVLEHYVHIGGTNSHATFAVVTGAALETPWSIVPLGSDDVVSDGNGPGETMGKSVRFFHANVDGRPLTLAVIARIERLNSQSEAYEWPCRISVYYLNWGIRDKGVWSEGPTFEVLKELRTRSLFDDANKALLKELSIPLPSGSDRPF